MEMLPLGDLRAELTLLARWNLASLDRRSDLMRFIWREGDRLPARLRNKLYRRLVADPYEAITASVRKRAEAACLEDVDHEALQLVLVEAMSAYRGMRAVFGRVPGEVDDERLVEAWVEVALAYAHERGIGGGLRRERDRGAASDLRALVPASEPGDGQGGGRTSGRAAHRAHRPSAGGRLGQRHGPTTRPPWTRWSRSSPRPTCATRPRRPHTAAPVRVSIGDGWRTRCRSSGRTSTRQFASLVLCAVSDPAAAWPSWGACSGPAASCASLSTSALTARGRRASRRPLGPSGRAWAAAAIAPATRSRRSRLQASRSNASAGLDVGPWWMHTTPQRPRPRAGPGGSGARPSCVAVSLWR